MMTWRAVVTLAAVALGAGVFVSGAKAAAPLCGSKQCAEEIAAGCAGLSGADFKACKKFVLDQCKISGETFCSCTDPTLPACGPTTTPTTTPPSACCTQSTPGGPFDQCAVVSLPQCFAVGGLFLLGRICTPNPCEITTTTSSTTTTTTLDPLRPCGRDPNGTCGGVCEGLIDQCVQDDLTGACVCVPGPCQPLGGIGSCQGACPSPATCTFVPVPSAPCQCIIPCAGSGAPDCNPPCGPSQGCVFNPNTSACECVP